MKPRQHLECANSSNRNGLKEVSTWKPLSSSFERGILIGKQVDGYIKRAMLGHYSPCYYLWRCFRRRYYHR